MASPPGAGALAPNTRFPDLSGPRLDLSRLDALGLSELHEYSTDPAFYAFMEMPPHRSIADTAAYIEKLESRMATGTAHYWFIRQRSTRAIVGSFGVHSIDWRKGSGGCGYGVARGHQGHGYATEAFTLVLAHLFTTLGFHRVTAVTHVDNAPSLRLLRRLGFVQEGVMRDYYLHHEGARHDAALYALLRPDYEHSHG